MGYSPPHPNGFAWTYVYGFVHPFSRRTNLLHFYTVDTASFSAVLSLFKTRFDPADERLQVLVVDHAGRHRSAKVVVPTGVQLVFTLLCTPELIRCCSDSRVSGNSTRIPFHLRSTVVNLRG